ncbi:MAG TPA: class I SAM-dependent methyltransferase [Actinomycetota bacterium]
MASDQATEKVREVWEAMSPGWERRREFLEAFTRDITDWMVRELDAQPGETILELAAGTGDIGFEVAPALGDSGRLITTDLAPGMVEVAKRRAAELGVTNAQVRVADATDTGLDGDSVDGILCRWGYMLMPDPAAALAETRRVLKPGGRHVLSVMGNPARSAWVTVISKALVSLSMMPAVDPNAPGGVFSLSDPGKLTAMMTDAGYRDVRTEEMEFHLRFPDFDEYWSFILEFAGAAAVLVRSFPEEQQRTVRDETERISEPYRTGEGYDFPGLTVNAVAT